MKRKLLLIIALLIFIFSYKSYAQIVLLGSFNPPDAGSLCGIGYHPDSAHVWIYGCNDDLVHCYDISGNLLISVSAPGGDANDVDIEIAPVEISFHSSIIQQGQLLFVNGENGMAEIFAIENSSGSVIDTLLANFGNDHVVGGSYHPDRNTFYLVQDNVPGAAFENLVAEINSVTGDTIHTFQITDYFNVSYGDVEVGANGNLFIVSSIEESIAEFTPEGIFVQTHELPAGVSKLSGIALDCAAGEAWVASTEDIVFHLGQFPCGSATTIVENVINPFILSEIRPNPFRSEFNFSIEVNQSCHVKLVLMNMLGQEINVIYNGMIAEGKKDFTILDESLQKGVYILMAESPEFKDSKRVVCIQ